MTTPRKVPPPDTSAAVLDRRGAAAFLMVSLPTLDRLIKDGAPCRNIGESGRKRFRFSREKLLDWLDARGDTNE